MVRRLLISASNVVSPGAEALALSLLPEIVAHRSRFSYTVLTPGHGKLTEAAAGWTDVEAIPARSRFPSHSLDRLWFEYRTMRSLVRRTAADAVLALGNIAPARTGVPTTVLMQHLIIANRQMLAQPPAVGRLGLAVNRFLFGRTARQATAVIVQTDHMRELVLKYYSAEPNCVHVVANNVAPAFTGDAGVTSTDNAGQPGTKDHANGVLDLIYPTAPYPYKNIDLVLEIAERLKSNDDASVQFILTLDESSPPGKNVMEAARSRGLQSHVVNAGMVDQAALAALYAGSSALFFPSLAESFGNPLLEAAAFGLPVLAADLPYARDVMGDAAVYFDPRSIESALTAINRLRDAKTWSELSTRSRARYESVPGWPEIAGRFLDIVESTIPG